jgi:hypothetical protein
MADLKRLSSLAFVVIAMSIWNLTGCGSNHKSANSPPYVFDIVGTWGLTALEDAPPVTPSNSNWTFKKDSTYDWFLLLDPYDLKGEGHYSLRGDTLFVDGIIENTVIANSPHDWIIIAKGKDTFSFLDDEGDQWTYTKMK